MSQQKQPKLKPPSVVTPQRSALYKGVGVDKLIYKRHISAMKYSRVLVHLALYIVAAGAIYGYFKVMNQQGYVYDECYKSSIPKTDKFEHNANGKATNSHLALVDCMKQNGYDYSAFSQCSFISNEEMCFTPSFLSLK